MLKGKAEIILTEVGTGKKEIIKEDNLVTNALNKLASINIAGYNPMINLIPIKKALRGLFLIDENIEENPNNFILPYNCKVIAHAGGNSNTNGVRCGSFNATESEDLDNGLKFVWDFATHQANGNIKCLSLTSELGGEDGFGNTYEQRTSNRDILTYLYNNTNIKMYDFGSTKCPFVDENQMYCYFPTSNIAKFEIYDLPMNRVSLTSSFTSPKLIKTIEVELGEPAPSVQRITLTKNFIYILTLIKNTNVEVNVYEIDKTNFSIARKISLSTWASTIEGNFDTYWAGKVLEDYIYIYRYNDNKYKNIYKVNLSNPNDIKTIINKGTSYPLMEYHLSFYNNRLLDTIGCIENDELNYLPGSSYGKKRIISSPLYDGLIYAIGDSSEKYNESAGNFEKIRLCFNAHYLATINNLSSPIVKTADKTMKVIYTITNS